MTKVALGGTPAIDAGGLRRQGASPHQTAVMGTERVMSALSPFNGLNLGRLLEARTRERPHHPFLIWAPFEGEAKTWTYVQFAADAARLAGGLAARGIRPGDRVLVHFENCPEALLVRFALARLGAVCVATNAMAVGPEIAHYAEASRATAAITQASFAELVSSYARHVRWVVVAERESGNARYGADSLDGLFRRTGTRLSGAPFRHRRHHVHNRHHGKAQGCALDPFECFVGLPLQRSGVRSQGGGRQPGISAAVSRRRALLVVFSCSLGRRYGCSATSVLGAPVLASFDRASSNSRIPRSLHVDGVARTRQCQSGTSIGNGPSAEAIVNLQSFNRIPGFVPSWGMTELVAPGIYGDPNFAPTEGALGRPSLAHQIRIRDLGGKGGRAR